MVRILNASALLMAWERAAAQPPGARASILLSVACPERSADEWAACPLGWRDQALLRLQEGVFGSRMETTGPCPNCQEPLEVQFRPADIEVPLADSAVAEREVGGLLVRFRLPSQADVMAALAAPDARWELLRRCVENAEALPPAVRDGAVAAMAELDPQADVQIPVACPSCGEHHEFAFDIAQYVWGELQDWAQSMLAEVHRLAVAYHWREQDILEMSAWRRRSYLDLIESEA